MTQVATQQNGTAPATTEQRYSDLELLLAREAKYARDLPVVDGVVIPKSAEGFYRLAEWWVTAGLVPDSLRAGNDHKATVAKVALAISAGAAVGLSHVHAVANVMVVNNRPSMWGDALVAVVRRSPECVEIVDSEDGETAICRAVRMKKLPDGSFHKETREARFSQKDAERGNLTGKGPWKSNPARMRQNRARAFALRDLFADLLMGIGIVEEEQDIAEARRAERSEQSRDTASEAMGGPVANAAPTPKPNAPEGGIGLPRPQGAAPPVVATPATTPAPDATVGELLNGAAPNQPEPTPDTLPGMGEPATKKAGTPRK